MSHPHVYTMHVRRKRAKIGVVPIQVADKRSGRDLLLKTIGGSKDPVEAQRLGSQGVECKQRYQGQGAIDLSTFNFRGAVKQSIQSIVVEGVNLVLGKISPEIGFDTIGGEVLKQRWCRSGDRTRQAS